MKRLQNENVDLDGVDLHILRILADDARTSMAEIARLVGMSAPSVSERIKRLQENGTIQGYTIRIDPAALGRPLSAWLRIRPVPGQLAAVTDIIRSIPGDRQLRPGHGRGLLLSLCVHVASVAALEAVIDRIIPYAMTHTAIIQSSPVAPRLPIPDKVRRKAGTIGIRRPLVLTLATWVASRGRWARIARAECFFGASRGSSGNPAGHAGGRNASCLLRRYGERGAGPAALGDAARTTPEPVRSRSIASAARGWHLQLPQRPHRRSRRARGRRTDRLPDRGRYRTPPGARRDPARHKSSLPSSSP